MLSTIDSFLIDARPRTLTHPRRGLLEFLYFGFKNARACLFVGAFFAAVLLAPRAGILGVPRYDLLLIAAIAILIYANFFTHHYIGDYRWYLAACAIGLYSRTTVVYTPLVLSFVLIGFFIWLAENISTFWGVWRYPNQLGAWSLVPLSKWSSWSLLVIMTFTIVAGLKHIKAKIHIAAE